MLRSMDEINDQAVVLTPFSLPKREALSTKLISSDGRRDNLMAPARIMSARPESIRATQLLPAPHIKEFHSSQATSLMVVCHSPCTH